LAVGFREIWLASEGGSSVQASINDEGIAYYVGWWKLCSAFANVCLLISWLDLNGSSPESRAPAMGTLFALTVGRFSLNISPI
jgi:hypothetical protein